MKTILGIILILGLFCAIAFSGARTDVVIGGITKQVDKFLGELNVKEASITRRLDDMEVAEKNLRKGKIGQQVKRETLQKSIREDEIGIGDIDKALARLRKSLTAKTDAQFNGITYTLAQQTELAKKLLERRKNSTKVIAGKAKALELVERSVVTLEEQHEKCLATYNGPEI